MSGGGVTLEDRVLELLERAPATYDGLRGSLGCPPSALDAAITTLERTQTIHRDRGRFYLVGGADVPPPQAAEATHTDEGDDMAKKTCSYCEAEKDESEFPKKGRQCKACLAEKAAAVYQAKHGKKAKREKRATPAPVARHIPGTFNGSGLMVLHFEDGVRIGPITVSKAGIAQMAHHVDLSAAALEEIFTWWKEQAA